MTCIRPQPASSTTYPSSTRTTTGQEELDAPFTVFDVCVIDCVIAVGGGTNGRTDGEIESRSIDSDDDGWYGRIRATDRVCSGNEYKVLIVYLVMTIYGTHTCTYVLRSPG